MAINDPPEKNGDQKETAEVRKDQLETKPEQSADELRAEAAAEIKTADSEWEGGKDTDRKDFKRDNRDRPVQPDIEAEIVQVDRDAETTIAEAEEELGRPLRSETSPELKSKSRLDQLNEAELIPDKLKNLPGIVGNVDIIAERTSGTLEFIVVDDQPLQLEKDLLFGKFDYVEEDTMADLLHKASIDSTHSRRPIAYSSMVEFSPEQLYWGVFEINSDFQEQGLGQAFLDKIYPVTKGLGYKFVSGYHNDAETAAYFLKRGNFLLEEIKDEYRPLFAELEREVDEAKDPATKKDDLYVTVRILEQSDIEKYIKDSRINTSTEDKLTYKEKFITFSKIMGNLNRTLETARSRKSKPGDIATAIEIVEDLNNLLPPAERYPQTNLSEDDADIIPTLDAMVNHLKTKGGIIADATTLDELKNNLI